MSLTYRPTGPAESGCCVSLRRGARLARFSPPRNSAWNGDVGDSTLALVLAAKPGATAVIARNARTKGHVPVQLERRRDSDQNGRRHALIAASKAPVSVIDPTAPSELLPREDSQEFQGCDIAPRRATKQIDAGSQPSVRVRRRVSSMSSETVPSLRAPIFSRFRAV